jgi:MoaA/NifB/PqqE/SkfB family radical SAM enzyme
LITKRHLEVLNLIENPELVTVVYNTNAMYMPDIETESVWGKFKNVEFIVSVDGVGEVAERVRGGTIWRKVVEFVDFVYNKGYRLEFNSVMHINNYNNFGVIASYIRNYNADWYINVLTYPKHLDISNLDSKEKTYIIETAEQLNLPNKDFIKNHLDTKQANH